MNKVKFSTLGYYPDIFLKSNLAVGVAFQIINEYETLNIMKIIPHQSKISSFDDEVDVEFINLFLNGVNEEFENLHDNNMEIYIDKFVNNFKFEKLQIRRFSSINNAKAFMNQTCKDLLH